MKKIMLFVCSFALLGFVSCNKEGEGEKLPLGAITVDGIRHFITEAGYMDGTYKTVIRFITEPLQGSPEYYHFEVSVPGDGASGWHTMAAGERNWSVTQLNTDKQEGYEQVIVEGRAFVLAVGQADAQRNRHFEVSFDITLEDGRKVSTDFRGVCEGSPLWVGGR